MKLTRVSGGKMKQQREGSGHKNLTLKKASRIGGINAFSCTPSTKTHLEVSVITIRCIQTRRFEQRTQSFHLRNSLNRLSLPSSGLVKDGASGR